jgi:hypothetical protein
MADERRPAPKPVKTLNKYDVAEPQSYECYTIDPAQQSTPSQRPQLDATPAAGASPKSATHPPRPWQDTGVEPPGAPSRYTSKDFDPPDPTVSKNITAAAESISSPREKRAIWIVHGMGQQIPFETVDQLTYGVLDAASPQPQDIKPRLRTVKIGNEVLQRVELDIEGAQLDSSGRVKQYELHLYESYWAPKTEGVAKLADVVGFLWDGGSRGILNWAIKFKRAMFGGMAQFRITSLTPLWLCLALVVLGSLAVVNGVILVASGAKSGVTSLSAFSAHWLQLSALATGMIAVASSFGVLLFTADLCKPRELPLYGHFFIGFLGWSTLFVTVLEIIKTAVQMIVGVRLDLLTSFNAAESADHGILGWLNQLFARIIEGFSPDHAVKVQEFSTLVILAALVITALAMLTRAILRSLESDFAGNLFLSVLALAAFALNVLAAFATESIWMGSGRFDAIANHWQWAQRSFWVWPFLILFSAKIRDIMVQYVGDVAIYIQPNKLDRFDDVRDKIKKVARTDATAIFTAYQPHTRNQFLYDHVAVVGHSLGSVIAYDTLNRLMLDDWLSHNALGIAERTKTLVTFGSPLNKTAFLFTIQGSDTLHIRERLASTVQPLITSYRKFRQLKWINVYSRNDIVSGKLKFYDLPGFQNQEPVPDGAVVNIVDRDASVPLIAHVSYWKNKTVWRELLAQIAP